MPRRNSPPEDVNREPHGAKQQAHSSPLSRRERGTGGEDSNWKDRSRGTGAEDPNPEARLRGTEGEDGNREACSRGPRQRYDGA